MCSLCPDILDCIEFILTSLFFQSLSILVVSVMAERPCVTPKKPRISKRLDTRVRQKKSCRSESPVSEIMLGLDRDYPKSRAMRWSVNIVRLMRSDSRQATQISCGHGNGSDSAAVPASTVRASVLYHRGWLNSVD